MKFAGFKIRKTESSLRPRVKVQDEEKSEDEYQEEIITSVNNGVIEVEECIEVTASPLVIPCKNPIKLRGPEMRIHASSKSKTALDMISLKRSTLADIQSSSNAEQEQYRRELELLPEQDISCYSRVSVEDFGIAMLRGMGYDPSRHNTKPHVLQRRGFDRAGLGANVLPIKKGDAVLKSDPNQKSMKVEADRSQESVVKLETDQQASSTCWLIPGLVVKIAEESHPAFMKKGVVQNVDLSSQSCHLTLLPEFGDGAFNNIPDHHLETVIPTLHEAVKIVSVASRYHGLTGILLDNADDQAVVSVKRPSNSTAPRLGKVVGTTEKIYVSLDDIC
eukprot:Filipodium_phascolosomae@DN5160_c0_g1_i1.p1